MLYKVSEVPFFLQDSTFFSSLDRDDEEFLIADENFKPNLVITNESDFNCLISTLHFWGVSSFTDVGMRFSLRKKEFGSLNEFSADVIHDYKMELQEASEPGGRKIVQYLIDQGDTLSEFSLSLVANDRATYRLEFIHLFEPAAKKTEVHVSVRRLLDCFATSAVQSKSAALLQTIHLMGAELQSSLLADAVDDIECFKYLLANHVTILNKFILSLAEQDKHEILQLLLSSGQVPLSRIPVDICMYIKSSECVEVLHEAGFKWQEWSALDVLNGKVASIDDRIDVLRCMCDLGCYMPSAAKDFAILHNRLYFLQALHERGCAWGNGAYLSSASPDVLEYAKENGCPIPRSYSSDKYDPYGSAKFVKPADSYGRYYYDRRCY